MSYPPPYNQQPGSSIGFEGLGQSTSAPYPPGSGYPSGYPPANTAPYPSVCLHLFINIPKISNRYINCKAWDENELGQSVI